MTRVIKFRAWDKSTGMQPWEILLMLDFKKVFTTNRLTLMQFTGLHDKNGVEIYEADILQYGEDAFKDRVPGNDKIVEWKPGGFNIKNTNRYKVIGNIMENPELLK